MDEIGFRSLSGDAYLMCEWQPPAKTDTQLILNDRVACEQPTRVFRHQRSFRNGENKFVIGMT